MIARRAAQNIMRLRGARRVWALAAIHGAARHLALLHDQISDRFQDGDRVVYLGNYMGYGAELGATIDELLDFRRRVLSRGGFACDVIFLRGAQEEMLQKLLQLQFASNPGEVLAWMVKAGVEPTMRAYGADLRQGMAATRDGPRTITRWTTALRDAINTAPGHMTLLSSLRHAAFTQEDGVLFVAAAVAPSRQLAAQGDAFWWGDCDILDLAAPFDGFSRVVRGFDRQRRGLVEREFAVSLDGGAGRGGRLLAACFAPNGVILDRVEA